MIRRLRAVTFASALALALATLASSALAGDPSAEELKSRGNQAMMELNYAEALSAYRVALAKNPSDVALHYNIGRAHQARGDYPAALDALLALLGAVLGVAGFAITAAVNIPLNNRLAASGDDAAAFAAFERPWRRANSARGAVSLVGAASLVAALAV